MGKLGWVALGAALVIAALAVGYWHLSGERDPGPPVAEPARSAAALASAALLRDTLPGIELDMPLAQVRRLRPRLRARSELDLNGLKAYDEQLDAERRALYFFAPHAPARLARVQLASKLAGDEAVVARVLDLQGRLGSPSAVWDCPPAADHVPTRRYQFKRGAADALDVIALLGERASATFYVAPAPEIRRSLAQAHCRPTPPEHAARFPALPAP